MRWIGWRVIRVAGKIRTLKYDHPGHYTLRAAGGGYVLPGGYPEPVRAINLI